jgi:hypothetical protein
VTVVSSADWGTGVEGGVMRKASGWGVDGILVLVEDTVGFKRSINNFVSIVSVVKSGDNERAERQRCALLTHESVLNLLIGFGESNDCGNQVY